MKAGKAGVALPRLHVILKSLILRRTKTQEIDGKPILQLPARTIEVVKCKFTDPLVFQAAHEFKLMSLRRDEEAFYKAVDAKVQLQFNKFLKRGEVMQ